MRTEKTIDFEPSKRGAQPTRARTLRLPDRYEDRGLIGIGAMGEVRHAWDRQLERDLAMKIIRPQVFSSAAGRRRFVAEAKTTAKLLHPNIVAVHDLGELDDGRLWFTMPKVDGKTFKVFISEVHAASRDRKWRATASGWTFRRLVETFETVCAAVGYAHERDVVHRDLKPDNIMIGAFGEIRVLDWGVAKRVRIGDSDVAPPAADGTWMGTIVGTPSFMSPEQAHGEVDRQGAASDVYSLGAILYQILTGVPPYQGDTAQAIVHQVRSGPPEPVGRQLRADHPPVPDALVKLAEQAMLRSPELRPRHAGELAVATRAWLDADRRRTLGLAAVREASELTPTIDRLRADAAELREEAAELLVGVPRYAPEEDKRPAWAKEDRAAELERDAEVLETRMIHMLSTALNHDPTLEEAHDRLAERYRQQVVRAEAKGDPEAVARYEQFLRLHDHGKHAAWLAGDGAVTLVTDPPGAAVKAYRYQIEHRRLVPRFERELGATPLAEATLGRGSYLLELVHPERATVRYPVIIGRRESWHGRRPGADEPEPIVLPERGELGGDDCYVPAGEFLCGGDPEAADCFPGHRRWLDGFVIKRFPVTVRAYLDFLNDLLARGREDDALRYAPAENLGRTEEPLCTLARDADGQFEIGRDSTADWELDWPVTLVDWHSANAYSEWLADRTGLAWRLPHELEIEKAARGVDGRAFPWGDFWDPTWANMTESSDQAPSRVAVERFPTDASPYGVRGLAGNVREWCGNLYSRSAPDRSQTLDFSESGGDDVFRVCRGGAWHSKAGFCRGAVRFVAKPRDRLTSLGFRVARSLD